MNIKRGGEREKRVCTICYITKFIYILINYYTYTYDNTFLLMLIIIYFYKHIISNFMYINIFSMTTIHI